MYSFAETISIIRKCLRKGVLWFIRDPSDPEASSASSSILAFERQSLTCLTDQPAPGDP